MQSKFAARELGMRLRNMLGVDSRADYDRRVALRCQTELDWHEYRRVMLYLPIERHNEIDTWQLLRWIWSAHPKIRVYAPLTLGKRIEAVQITPQTKFLANRWGIPEPSDGPMLEPGEALNLILTPLLGFDLSGHRVGYGRGFYDRYFVSQPAARRVGLAYECLLSKTDLPAEEHDVRLDEVITEERRYMFGSVQKQPR